MKGFIEVISTGGKTCLVNVAHIEYVAKFEAGHAAICFRDPEPAIECQESYEVVKELIAQAQQSSSLV